MNIKIRQEKAGDLSVICDLIEKAFAGMKESDHREQYLVQRLHDEESFIPGLSLVAEADNDKVVGYILLTEIKIASDNNVVTSLAVAPLAVLPEYQRQGIGGMLLNEAHNRAAASGYESTILLGHADYYPRFGYRQASDFGILFPFDAPLECCLVCELKLGALNGISGMVHYPASFFEY